ncbi:hypothetical protein LMG33810_002360 [Carnimonas sp. LMG 33810]
MFDNGVTYRCTAPELSQPNPYQRLRTCVLVDGVLERFTSLEARHFSRSNLDRLASLGVATSTCSAFLDAESTEAYQSNSVAFLEAVSDRIDQRVESTSSCRFRNVGRSRDGFDQFRFIHYSPLGLTNKYHAYAR